MRHCFVFILIGSAITLSLALADAQPKEATIQAGELSMQEPMVIGTAAQGLQPIVIFEKNRGDNDWWLVLKFSPSTNFAILTWLAPFKYFRAKFQICLTKGDHIQPTDPRLLDAMTLPFFTTVSNALRGVRWDRRGGQWPHGIARQSFQTASFSLRSGFGTPFTNDFLLQITPLMYKENTNNQTAWLVEFPPIRVKLKIDGTVEKLE